MSKKSKNRYKSSITQEEIKKTYKIQCKKSDWTFYKEREFVENLLNNRFNFLLVIYSLFIMAFVEINGKINQIIVLSLGFIITFLVSLTIFRTYSRLIIILSFLHDLEKEHIFPFLRKEIKARKYSDIGNINPIIGIVIPCIFVFTFILAIIMISTNIWIINNYAK